MKTYVLDTSVLLYDPYALRRFQEHNIVIPMTVIEEIDSFKKDLSSTGYAAREISRILDNLRLKGSLSKGVALDGGGTVRVDFEAKSALTPPKNDDIILGSATKIDGAILISRDTNMRLKGDAMGLSAEDYLSTKIQDPGDAYTGFRLIHTTSDVVDKLYRTKSIDLPEDGLCPNQCVLLKNGSQSALATVRDGSLRLVPNSPQVWGISPRNKEQTFALNLLMDPSISLVTISGLAGSGKTLLSIAAALAQTADDARYRRVLVSRPIYPMGKDLGYLPGDINDKLNPWMKPIYDNLELLVSGKGRYKGTPRYQYLIDSGLIEVEPLTYIRGRSIPDQFLLIDEAQNMSPHEIKTVITRAGEGTKVVLTGDPHQIDNPYIDGVSNGLTYVIERFKDQPEAGHITMIKGERSRLSELAARLL